MSLVYGVQIIGRRVTERSEEVGQDKKGVDGTQDTDPLLWIVFSSSSIVLIFISLNVECYSNWVN